ncbi:Uncharacterized protein GBIM_05571 [Gryllus bimaculatus]|nr:Uncharacterized protein GBIM_05571 [Gryllus bimaculatus]
MRSPAGEVRPSEAERYRQGRCGQEFCYSTLNAKESETIEKTESPRSVLLQVMNRFTNTTCDKEEQNEIILRAEKDYNDLPNGIDEIEEEISLLKEILVKQEQTYQAEVQDFQKQIEDCQLQLQESETQNEILDKQVCEEYKRDEDLKSIMDKYDDTVCLLVNEKLEVQETHNNEIMKLEEDLRKEQENLSNSEKQFAELHKTYESKKQCKAALERQLSELKMQISRNQMNLTKSENAFLELEKHANEQIDKANQELNIIRQNYQGESTRLKGLAKKLDLQIASLEGMIQQKTRENIELAAIYDDCLIKMTGNT